MSPGPKSTTQPLPGSPMHAEQGAYPHPAGTSTQSKAPVETRPDTFLSVTSFKLCSDSKSQSLSSRALRRAGPAARLHRDL